MLDDLVEDVSNAIVDADRDEIISDYHEARGKGRTAEQASLYCARRVLRRLLRRVFSVVG